MARKALSVSVKELEHMLAQVRKRASQLQKRRTALASELSKVDQELADLGVTPTQRAKRRKRVTPRTAKKRAKPAKKPGRKKMTLADHVSKILTAAKKAMSPKEIAQVIKKKGVSKSKGLANQIVIILAKGKVAAKKVGRGLYVAGKGR